MQGGAWVRDQHWNSGTMNKVSGSALLQKLTYSYVLGSLSSTSKFEWKISLCVLLSYIKSFISGIYYILQKCYQNSLLTVSSQVAS